jgi:hypothetical protein
VLGLDVECGEHKYKVDRLEGSPAGCVDGGWIVAVNVLGEDGGDQMIEAVVVNIPSRMADADISMSYRNEETRRPILFDVLQQIRHRGQCNREGRIYAALRSASGSSTCFGGFRKSHTRPVNDRARKA